MKKYVFLIITFGVLAVSTNSCKSLARAAAKHWSKKQIKEFVNNCETKAGKMLGDEKAKQVCDCVVDVAAEKYHNYEDVKSVNITELLKMANGCR